MALQYVDRSLVMTGFMNGIAVQIWQKQIALLIGVKAMKGSALLNWPVTFATTGLVSTTLAQYLAQIIF